MNTNPETVFEVIVSRLLKERADFVTSVDGTLTFVVTGENPGVWTIDLRRGAEAAVYRGKIENPSVLVMVENDYLDNVISGDVDAKWAIANNKLGIIGNKSKLQAFATALGGGSSIDLRASQQAH
jgi:alkyl sulfatase BDS1-like metallo-beta-lactamase superfamily hydrolase